MRSISKAAAVAAGLVALGAATAQAAAPPDGRGYELITPQGPVDKTGRIGAAVSEDGNRTVFMWGAPLPTSDTGYFQFGSYVADRAANGWSVRQLVSAGPGAPALQIGQLDLDTLAGVFSRYPTRVDPGGIWARGADGHVTQLMSGAKSPDSLADSIDFAGASADRSHIFFVSSLELVPGAVTFQQNVYEITKDGLRLASLLPDGTPVEAVPGSSEGDAHMDEVSRDGRVLVFTNTTGFPNTVYLRIDGDHTVDAAASQRSTPDPAGPQARRFRAMSSDGKRVIFQSSEELTDDARTAGGTSDELYQYDVDTGVLRTLTSTFTTDASPPVRLAPQVLGVLGATSDVRRIYFVARGALPGSAAVDGAPHIYLYDAASDSVRYVATLDPTDDGGTWTYNVHHAYSVMTDDGRHLAFLSRASLAGAHNVDSHGVAHQALYLYDAATGVLECASCAVDGHAATDDASFTRAPQGLGDTGVAPTYGGNPDKTPARSISEDGKRLFFVTGDALVPQDLNGRLDVYEYEGGGPRLVSPGQGPHDATYLGTSPSGDDVMFVTDEPLVPGDEDKLPDMYDARVGGGFPTAPAPAPLAACAGDACQGPSSLGSAPPVAASITFAGPPTTDVQRRPAASQPRRSAKVAVTRKVVARTSLGLSVHVPGAGRLTVHGSRVAPVTRQVTRAATYTLRVRLTAKARRELHRKRRLTLSLRVGYVPVRGKATSTTVRLTVKG